MKKKLLSMLCLLCACITAMAADKVVTFDFVNNTYGLTRVDANSGSYTTSATVSSEDVSIDLATKTGNGYRLLSKGLVVYRKNSSTAGDNTLTLSAPGNITAVKVTVDNNFTTLKFNDVTATSSEKVYSWVGDAETIAINIQTKSNNAITQLEVTYSDGQDKPAAPAAPYFTDEDGIVIADGATVEEGTIITVVSDTEGAVALFVDNDEAVDELYEVNYGEAESLTLKAQATVTVDGVTSDPSEVSAITIHKPVKATPVFTVTPAPGAHVNGTQLSVSATLDGAELDSDEWLVSVTPEVLNFDSEHTSITVKAEAMDPETEEVYEKSYTYTWRATAAPVLSDGGLGDTITITAEDADRMIVAIDPSDNAGVLEEIEGDTFNFTLTYPVNTDVKVTVIAERDGYADAETVKVYTIKHPEGYNNEYYSEDTYTLITSTDELDTTGQRKYVLSGFVDKVSHNSKEITINKNVITSSKSSNNIAGTTDEEVFTIDETANELTVKNAANVFNFYMNTASKSGKSYYTLLYDTTTEKGDSQTMILKKHGTSTTTTYKNNLQSEALTSEISDFALASISVDNTGVATIKFDAESNNNRNWIRLNPNANAGEISPIFSCYASGQKAVKLWGQKIETIQVEPAEMRIVPSAENENESEVVKGYKLELRAVDSKWADVEGAKIYYAVSEGTINPFTDYKLYTGPVTIDTDCYVYVLAIADGYKTADSDLKYITKTVEYEVAAAGHEFREPEKVEYTGGDGEARFTFGNYYIIMAQDGEGNVWAKSTTRTADGYKAVNLGSVTDGKIGVGITEDPVAEYALFKHATAGTYAMMQHTVASWGADKDEAEAMAEWREGATYLHHDHFNHADEPAEARVTAAEATTEPAYMTLTYNSVTMPNGHALSFNADTKEFVCDCNAGSSGTPLMLAATTGNGGISTGVENVEAEAEGDAQWYNLQGIEVNGESLTPGIYVRRQGESVTKVLVR